MFKEYAKFYNLIYAKRNYKAEAEFVYKWAGNPSLIVDLGCGIGRHHKYWKCPVVGVDQSKEMLKLAPRNKQCGNKYYQADIENLPKELQNFRCYFALFNVVGYCNLGNILSNLNQFRGGIFIFDVWDIDKFEKSGGFQKKIKKFRWGSVGIEPFLWDGVRKNLLKIRVIPKGKDPFSEFHNVFPYSLKRIEELCQEYGYRGVRKNTKGWSAWYKLVKQ